MPALLFLLHGRGTGADPSAGADLVSIPAAVLLQRPFLAGPPALGWRHWLHHGGQRLHTHRRLGPRPDAGGPLLARSSESNRRRLRRPTLPGARVVPAA